MSWIEKTQPTPFDRLPIPGFFMVDGDFLFTLTRNNQFQGRTRPMIAFPSGSNRALWPSRTPEHLAEFYLFGEMSLPVHATLDDAYDHASLIAERYGYEVTKRSAHALEVWDERDDDHFRVTYDGETGFVANAEAIISSVNHSFGG